MGQQCIMSKLHKILDIIFIVSMIVSTVAFGIATIIFDKGHLLGDLFCIWIMILTFSIVGLCIQPTNEQPIESSEEPTEYDQWDGDESDKIQY